MAAKDSEAEVKKPEQAAPQPQVIAPVVVQAEKPKSNQSALTIAIISAVALFFVGLGLGYLLGHSTNDRARFPNRGIQFRGDSDERRFYLNSRGCTNNDDSPTTNPNSQTN